VPYPDPPSAQAVGRQVTSRRAFLRCVLSLAGASVVGTGALAGLAGCDIFGAEGNPAAPPAALTGLLSDTATLADRYDVAIASVATLATLLTPMRDAHRAHVQALAEAIGAPVPAARKASSAPADREQALAALRTAEKAARDDAVNECVASPPQFAALLASIAAARASHMEVLK
jgi:hypothetical protein